MPRYSRAFFLCLPLLALAACEPSVEAPAGAARPAASVTTQTLAPQVIEERLPALGTLLARESVQITSTVNEKVRSLHFDEGQYVEKGALLAVLEQAEEQAQLASAKADLAEQDREIKRLKNLLATQSAARNEYDARISAKERADAKIAEVQAKIDERTLRAPFSGVTGLREVSPGAYLSAGSAIISLDDLSVMRLDLNIPSLLLGSLRVGMSVNAHSDALDQSFVGTIVAINPRIDPVSRSVMVRAVLDNPDGVLKPGMLMRLSLLKDQREGIMVPESALQSIERRHYVWLMGGDGLAERREVELGIRTPGWVEVLAGLAAGDQLITEGYLMLRPGSPVVARES